MPPGIGQQWQHLNIDDVDDIAEDMAELMEDFNGNQ
jgi:hypothetical protein